MSRHDQINVQVFLTPAEHKQLGELAKAHGLPMAEILRQGLLLVSIQDEMFWALARRNRPRS